MKAAAAAGLSPHVYFADCVDGTMLLEFVDGEAMDADAIRNRENAVSCAQLLHQLHTIEGFQGDYDIFQIIRKNVNQIRQSGFEMSLEQARVIELVEKIREIIFNNGVPNCASHNDVFSGNFVRLQDKKMIIDWECGALADPHWEVSALSSQVGMTNAVREAYLVTYFGTENHPAMCRIPLFEAACLFYWWTKAICRIQQDPEETPWQEDEKDWRGWFKERTGPRAFDDFLNAGKNYHWQRQHGV